MKHHTYGKKSGYCFNRIAALLLLLTIVLSLVGCGINAPDNFSEAVTTAKSKLNELNSMKYNGYRYSSGSSGDEKSGCFVIAMTPIDYSGYKASGMLTESMCRSAAKSVYKEVKDYFAKVDAEIEVMIVKDSSNILYTFFEYELQN